MLTEPMPGRNASPSLSPVATMSTTDNCHNLFNDADSVTITERYDSHRTHDDVAVLRQYSSSGFVDSATSKNFFTPSTGNVRPLSTKDIVQNEQIEFQMDRSINQTSGTSSPRALSNFSSGVTPPCSKVPKSEGSIPCENSRLSITTESIVQSSLIQNQTEARTSVPMQQHSNKIYPSSNNATFSTSKPFQPSSSPSPPVHIPPSVPTDHSSRSQNVSSSTSSPSTTVGCNSPNTRKSPSSLTHSRLQSGSPVEDHNLSNTQNVTSNHTTPLLNSSDASPMTTTAINKHRYSCSIGGPSSSMSSAPNRKSSVPVSQDVPARGTTENPLIGGVSNSVSGATNRPPIRNRESNSSQVHRSQGRNHTEPRNRSIVSATARTCCLCCISFKSIPENISRGTSSVDPPQSKVEAVIYDEGVTYEEAFKWSQSFDCLMSSPPGREIFHEFLKSEYSEENILFWLACEELKRETTSEGIEEKARLIYEDFISILSPKEVSLDSRVREIINSNMLQPTLYTFEEAQQQVFTLMQRDSYSRFINSKIYKEALSRAQGSADPSLLHLPTNQSHSS